MPGRWEDRHQYLKTLRSDDGLYFDPFEMELPEEHRNARLWSVGETYYVANFASYLSDAVAPEELVDSSTAASVRGLLPFMEEASSWGDLAMSSVIVSVAGEPSPELEERAQAGLRVWFTRPLTRDNVFEAYMLYNVYLRSTFADDLTFEMLPFEVLDREDESAAWAMLSMSHRAENEQEILEHFSPQLATAESALRDPTGRLLKEIALAARLPGIQFDPNNITPEMASWIRGLQGCSYAPLAHRMDPEQDVCTLEATYLLVTLGWEDFNDNQ